MIISTYTFSYWSKKAHKNIPNKCKKVKFKTTFFINFWKFGFAPPPALPHTSNSKQFQNHPPHVAPIPNTTHKNFDFLIKYFCMLCLVTHFDAKPPKNQIFNFSHQKPTEKFHHRNTRPALLESPSNIMKFKYGHLQPHGAHFLNTAQNKTPCPKIWNFQIWTFCTKNSKMFCFVLLRPQVLFGTQNTTNWPLSPEFVPKTWPPQYVPDFAIRWLKQAVFCRSNHLKRAL